MWAIYDELLSQVHQGEVKDVSIGLYWTALQSKTVGLAMGAPKPSKNFRHAGQLRGMDLQEVAKMVKSWNNLEASIGLSAINSSLNTIESVDALQDDGYLLREDLSIFDELAKIGHGKKVAVIGHFPVVRRITDVCDVTILERLPQEGDLPDPAAEYILKEQDIVLMTASTFINKTAPRLLELAKDAFTIVVGPSTPITETIFNSGADMIAGLAVDNEQAVLNCVKEAGDLKDYRSNVRNVNLFRRNHPLSKLFM